MDEEREERLRLERQAEVRDLQEALAFPPARRVLWRLLRGCGVRAPSYHQDARFEAYQEGRRSVGLQLERAMRLAAPRLFLEAELEHLTAEVQAEQAALAAESGPDKE